MIKREMNKKELADHQKKFQKLEKENIELRTRFDEYSKANRKLRSKNEQLIKEISTLQLTNQQLQKENQEVLKSSKILEETNRRLEAKINAGIKGQISKYDSIISKIKERNQVLENEVVRLTDLSQNQAREIYILNDALDTNLKDSNIEDRLVYEVSSLREINRNSKELQEQQRATIEELQNELQVVNNRYNQLDNQFSQIQKNYSDTFGKLQQLEQLYVNCQRSKADLEQEKLTLLEQMARKADEIDAVRNAGDSISKDKEQLLEQLHTLKNEFRTCSQQLQQSREVNNELRAFLQNREALINDLSQKCSYLQQVEQDLRRKVSILTTENNSINSQLDAFSKMNYESQQVVSDTTMEISRLRDLSEKLQLQNQMLKDKIEKVDMEKKEDMQRYKDKLVERDEDLVEAKNEKRILKEEMERQAKELSESRLEIKKLEIKLNESEMKYMRLEESKNLMQKTLLDQLNSERSRVNEVEGDLEKIQNTMCKMENDNNRMHILLKAQKRSKQNNLMKNLKETRQEGNDETESKNEQMITNEPTKDQVPVTQTSPLGDSTQKASVNEGKLPTPLEPTRKQHNSQYSQAVSNGVYSPYDRTTEFVSATKYLIGGGIGSYSLEGDNSPTSHYLTNYRNSTPTLSRAITSTPTTNFTPSDNLLRSDTPTPSPQYPNTSMSAKRTADRYKGSDGKPLDLFTLAYSTPSVGNREGAFFTQEFESPLLERPRPDSRRY